MTFDIVLMQPDRRSGIRPRHCVPLVEAVFRRTRESVIDCGSGTVYRPNGWLSITTSTTRWLILSRIYRQRHSRHAVTRPDTEVVRLIIVWQRCTDSAVKESVGTFPQRVRVTRRVWHARLVRTSVDRVRWRRGIIDGPSEVVDGIAVRRVAMPVDRIAFLQDGAAGCRANRPPRIMLTGRPDNQLTLFTPTPSPAPRANVLMNITVFYSEIKNWIIYRLC